MKLLSNLNFTYMNEILKEFLPSFITEHVFIPYLFALILVVEWVRYQVDSIDKYMKPKHLVLFVGVVLAWISYFLERLEGVELSFKLLLTSFFISTLFYEYVVKPIKQKFFPTFNDKQKQ